MRNKIEVYFLFVFLFYCNIFCNRDTSSRRCEEWLTGAVKKVSIAIENDGSPVLIFDFNLQNRSAQRSLFIAKANAYDKKLQSSLTLTCLHNGKFSGGTIYTNDIYFIQPDSSVVISGYMDKAELKQLLGKDYFLFKGRESELRSILTYYLKESTFIYKAYKADINIYPEEKRQNLYMRNDKILLRNNIPIEVVKYTAPANIRKIE